MDSVIRTLSVAGLGVCKQSGVHFYVWGLESASCVFFIKCMLEDNVSSPLQDPLPLCGSSFSPLMQYVSRG